MAQTGTENPNWTLNIPPLAGVQPFDPTRVRPESGPYPVQVVSATLYTKTSPEGTNQTIKCACKIIGGKFDGGSVDIYLGFDKLGEQGDNIQKKIWTATLLSIGMPTQLLANPNQIGPNTFKNSDGSAKRGYVLVQNAPEGEKDGRDNRNFITPEQYATLLAQAQQAAAAAGGGTPKLGTPAGAPPPAFGAGVVPQPQGTLASPGGALAGAGAPQVQNGVTQLMPPPAAGGVPAPAPAAAGGVSWG